MMNNLNHPKDAGMAKQVMVPTKTDGQSPSSLSGSRKCSRQQKEPEPWGPGGDAVPPSMDQACVPAATLKG